MKLRHSALLLSCVLLGGCVTATVQEIRETDTAMTGGDAIVVLGRRSQPTSDEHDVAASETAVAEDGTVVVEGAATLRDLNREFDWNLPDDEAATVAGLVIHEAQQIPERGQIFVFHGFRFEITGRQRNQITQLRVTPLRQNDTAPG